MPSVCLWFDGRAEEAQAFYRTVFRDTRSGPVMRGPGSADAPGRVLSTSFTLEGQPFIALDGGPQFRFGEAVSFLVACADQDEVDRIWTALGAGGEPGRCGWLKDRFGLSWQVVPQALQGLLADPDPGRAARIRAAFMGMGRIDLAALERARDGAQP